MIQYELPLFNHGDHKCLLDAADRLVGYSEGERVAADLLRSLARRLERVLLSAANTKYTRYGRKLACEDAASAGRNRRPLSATDDR